MIKKILIRRLDGSFTVESAVIIPLFTFITVALMAMGFYVRNTVMVRSACWKSAIEVERITSMSPGEEALAGAAKELREELQSQGMFMKNINADVYKNERGGISVSVSADSSFSLPVFGNIGRIEASEEADSHNPAANMRRWHALGMMTGTHD